MRIFSRVLPIALVVTFFVSASFASEGIYDKDLVRGFLSLKGDFRSMKSDGVKFINEVTGESYAKNYLDGHVEIGAEYLQLRTWFDIDFMPLTPERGNTEWFSYGVTWMWGYKIFPQNSFFNIIPSVGPGVELQNIRSPDRVLVLNSSEPDKEPDKLQQGKLYSSFGPTLNLELELRLQASQFSVGIYGGYKVVRHDNFNYREINGGTVTDKTLYWPREVNADKAFVGLKISWTMLNNFQKREKELL